MGSSRPGLTEKERSGPGLVSRPPSLLGVDLVAGPARTHRSSAGHGRTPMPQADQRHLDLQALVSSTARRRDPALALRARQLIDPRTRQRLARSLRGVVQYVDRAVGRPVLVSAVVIDRAAVSADRETILGLAERLEGVDPVNPRGIVLAQKLLTDGIDSPLSNRCSTRTIAQAAWEIADALGADPPIAGFDNVV